jgi:AraC family transcriptional regulator, positive regulator of tynA and feaB
VTASDRPISVIAHRWGFSDTSHFSRTFKAHYGYSPTDYRNTYPCDGRLPDASVHEPVAQVQAPDTPGEKTGFTTVQCFT